MAPHLRARVKADRLRVRLGGEPGQNAAIPSVKPKGTHRSTFRRLRDELIKTEMLYLDLLLARRVPSGRVSAMVRSDETSPMYPSVSSLIGAEVQAWVESREIRDEAEEAGEAAIGDAADMG
jgi:hypothetical protein